MKARTWLGIGVLTALGALAIGCSGGASDDSGSDEAAASIFDPRVRKYLFDVHASKAPECSTPKCTMQLRLRAYGRLGRLVDDSCFVFDLSGQDKVATDMANAFYKPLESTAGGRLGEYETNAGLDPASKYSHGGLFGDVLAVEFSVEEGPSGSFKKLDKETGCFADGKVRHTTKTKFDEDKNSHRSDHLLDIVFGSRVEYVFGQNGLAFTSLDCDGKWGIFPECPAIDDATDGGAHKDASADGAAASDAGSSDAGQTTDAAIPDSGPPPATPGVSSPPPASADSTASPDEGSGGAASGDPESDPASNDPASGDPSAPKKKSSSSGGCSQSSGAPAGEGAAGALLLAAVALASQRRRRRGARP